MIANFKPVEWKDFILKEKEQYKLVSKPLTPRYNSMPQQTQSTNYNNNSNKFNPQRDLEYPSIKSFKGSYGDIGEYQSSMPKTSAPDYSMN